tara:strand:- start:2963 stop:3193 length:231 start_codon:yes stop_codon:yes gene_type:complete
MRTKEIYIDPWPGPSGGYTVSFHYGAELDAYGMECTLTLGEAMTIAREHMATGLGPVILDGDEITVNSTAEEEYTD